MRQIDQHTPTERGSAVATPSLERAHGAGADGGEAVTSSPHRELPPWPALLELPVLHLALTFETREPMAQPRFFGSTLRGMFGHALAKTACVKERRRCAGCEFVDTCAYPGVFEPPPPDAIDRGPRTPPARYVLRWRYPRRGTAPAPARTHRFELILFGPGASFDRAVLRALRIGLGGGIGRRRIPAELVRVATVLPQGGARGGVHKPAPLSHWLRHAPPLSRRTVLRLRTPLQIRENGVVARRITFSQLVRAATRRLRLITPEQPEAARAWVGELWERAEQVRTVAPRLRHVRLRRSSARQKRLMTFDGFVGDLVVEGDLGPFTPLLAATQILHIGRHTPFGFGWIELPRPPAASRKADAGDAPSGSNAEREPSDPQTPPR